MMRKLAGCILGIAMVLSLLAVPMLLDSYTAYAADGDIGSQIDSESLSAGKTYSTAKVQHVYDGIFVVSFEGGDDDGWVETFQVESDGTFSGSPSIEEWEFDGDEVEFIRLLRIGTSNYWSVTYAKGAYSTGSDGYTFTFYISNAGDITTSETDSLTWRDKGADSTAADAAICAMENGVYAVVYRDYNPGTTFRMCTFSMDDSGNISDAVADEQELDSSTGGNVRPDIVSTYGGVVIVYSDSDNGKLLGWPISNGGDIGAASEGSWTFQSTTCRDPRVISNGGGIHTVVYQGPDSDGFLKTTCVSYTTIIRKSATYNELISNLAVGDSQEWGIAMYVPTAALGSSEVSGTITLTATAG